MVNEDKFHLRFIEWVSRSVIGNYNITDISSNRKTPGNIVTSNMFVLRVMICSDICSVTLLNFGDLDW